MCHELYMGFSCHFSIILWERKERDHLPFYRLADEGRKKLSNLPKLI